MKFHALAPLGRAPTVLGLALAITASTTTLLACNKKGDAPTCSPDEYSTFKIRVFVQPADIINPDDHGEALATELRLYQLSGDQAIPTLGFREVWKDGAAALGDSYLAEEIRTIYPGRPETLEIEPDPKATHLLAVAILREPTGIGWYRLWEVPKFHGDSVCLAKAQGKTWPDPCFYVSIERNVIDGGHTPPPAWVRGPTDVQCPGPPLKVKPPPPEPKKKKKKRKKLKDFKAPEAPEAPKAPELPKAPEAPKAPELPKAPG